LNVVVPILDVGCPGERVRVRSRRRRWLPEVLLPRRKRFRHSGLRMTWPFKGLAASLSVWAIALDEVRRQSWDAGE